MKKIIKWFKNLFTSSESIDPQGISEFKSLIKNGLIVATSVKESNADGQITGVEWISIGRSALPLIGNARNWKILKAQGLDFTAEEGIELVEYAQSLGIIKEDAKAVIMHVISAIEKGYSLYMEDIKPIILILKK